MRRMLVFLVAAGLSLVSTGPGFASPAAAVGVSAVHSSTKPPSAPRALKGTGLTDQGYPRRALKVSWRQPASAGSAKIRTYVVKLTARSGKRMSSRIVVPATKTSATFHGLKYGRSYRISVRAVSRAGRSPAAKLRYTLPKPAPAWVFAVDTKAKAIVRVPVAGGAVTKVAAQQTAWDVNLAGDVYVLDREAKTVTRYPANGSTPGNVGAGFTDPTDVQLDAAGNVYVVDGTRVIRTTRTGRAQRVVADPVFGAVFVAPDGTVSTASNEFDLSDGSTDTFGVTLLTYPAAGGPVVRRTLRIGIVYFVSDRGQLLGDGAGNLFLHFYGTGGGDFRWWSKLAPGGTTVSELYTRIANYAVAVDPRNRFSLLQTRKYCDSISEFEGACTPDLTVQNIRTYRADGTQTTTRVAPFTLQRTSTGGELVAADRQGRFFLAQSEGPTAGLFEYGPKGGARTRLASGTFLEPKRNN